MSKGYQRKTVDEYQLWAMYEGEWEEVSAYETRLEARQDLRAYRLNDYNAQDLKIIKKRIKKGE